MGFSPNGGKISGADDVAISNPTAGQILGYEEVTQTWQNRTISGMGQDTTIPSSAHTTSYTATLSDAGTCVEIDSSSVATFTIPGSQTLTPYTESFTGADNSSWSNKWAINGSTGSAVITSNQGLLVPPAASPYLSSPSATFTTMDDLLDTEIILDVTFVTGAAQQYLWIAWRTDGTQTGGQLVSGYNIEWNPVNGGYDIRRHVDGIHTTLATVTKPYTTAARIKIRHAGPLISTKIWNVGSPEPASWDYSNTDPDPYSVSGKLYLLMSNGSGNTARAVAFDNVSVENIEGSSAVTFPLGTVLSVCQLGTGRVTLTPGAGVTLRSSSSLTTRAQYSEASLRQSSQNVWIISGDMA